MPASSTLPVSKNREAMEFRAQAAKLRKEILEKPDITVDELTKLEDSVNLLERKANIAAGYTPEEEIRRQGEEEIQKRLADTMSTRKVSGAQGPYEAQLEELLTRTTPPDRIVTRSANGGRRVLKRKAAAMEWLRMQINEHFDGEFEYMQAMMNPDIAARCSQAQLAIMKQASEITRSIIGEDPSKGMREYVLPGLRLPEIGGMATRTIVGTTGDPSGGSFLLPLQQEPSIFMYEVQQFGLLQTARRYTATGRTLRIPFVEQTNAGVTRPLAGIANITIVGEGSSKPVAEPAFNQQLLTVYKYAAISQFGDETIEDDFTGDMQPVVTSLVGGQVLNRINEDVTIAGTGSAMPLGALNAANPALLLCTRQTAATITTSDIFEMYAKHTHGPQSFWLASRRVVQALFALALPAGTTGTAFVTFLPDLRGVPQMRILGYPVYITDILGVTLGTTGDLNLINPEFYALAMRRELTVESSIHAAFIQDVTTYRFLARAGGVPIPDGTYAYASSGGSSGVKVDQHSPFTSLGLTSTPAN